jgi:group I intron endonuclease
MNSECILNRDCYIYRIYNSVDGKSYIGLTITTIQKRWKAHLSRAKNGTNWLLYRAIRKHGENKFTIECIETCSKITFGELCKKEIKYIKKFNTFYLTGWGYNMTLGGEGTYGAIMSQSWRMARSKRLKGKKRPPFSEEWKRNIGIASAKKIYTSEYRAKISKVTSGKRNPMYGKKQTSEAKRKMSLTKDKNAVPFYLKSPSGEIFKVGNETLFSREHGLTPTHVNRVKHRLAKTHKNWTLYDTSKDIT